MLYLCEAGQVTANFIRAARARHASPSFPRKRLSGHYNLISELSEGCLFSRQWPTPPLRGPFSVVSLTLRS